MERMFHRWNNNTENLSYYKEEVFQEKKNLLFFWYYGEFVQNLESIEIFKIFSKYQKLFK